MVPANRSTRRRPPVRRRSRLWASVLLPVACCTVWWGCEEADPPGPFELVEMETWKATNKSHLGRDGILCKRPSAPSLTKSPSCTRPPKNRDSTSPSSKAASASSSTCSSMAAIRSRTAPISTTSTLQYLVYVDRDFDPTNPLEKSKFDVWRAQYIRQLVSKIYDHKYPLLRHTYDERWGVTLFSRLVFQVYIDNSESELRPRVSDIGDHIFLVDEEGVAISAKRSRRSVSLLFRPAPARVSRRQRDCPSVLSESAGGPAHSHCDRRVEVRRAAHRGFRRRANTALAMGSAHHVSAAAPEEVATGRGEPRLAERPGRNVPQTADRRSRERMRAWWPPRTSNPLRCRVSGAGWVRFPHVPAKP